MSKQKDIIMEINRRNSLKLIASTVAASPFFALSDSVSNNSCEIPDDYVFTRISLDSGYTFYFNFFDGITLTKLITNPPYIAFHQADYVFQSIRVDDMVVGVCLKERWENVPKEELDGRSLFKILQSGACAGFSGDVKIQQKRIIDEYGRGNIC